MDAKTTTKKRKRPAAGEEEQPPQKEAEPESISSSSSSSSSKKKRKKKRRHEGDGEGEGEENTTMKALDAALSNATDNDDEKKRKKKKNRRKAVDLGEGESGASVAPCPLQYDWEVDESDHCETPLEAYAHLEPFLTLAAKRLNKLPSQLQIYDPYYCEGAMREHLRSLGFTNVHNEKKDFYASIEAGTTPTFDVLVTNPPYSLDHIPRLLAFIASQQRPSFLLLPNWVYTKPYYARFLPLPPTAHGHSHKGPPRGKHQQQQQQHQQQQQQQQHGSGQGQGQGAASPALRFYVAPAKRYLYATPKSRRQQKSAKYTSPFDSFWYCCFPLLGPAPPTQTLSLSQSQSQSQAQSQSHSHSQAQASAPPVLAAPSSLTSLSLHGLQEAVTRAARGLGSDTCSLSLHTPSGLPLLHLDERDERKRREKNNQKRKKHKKRKAGAESGSGKG